MTDLANPINRPCAYFRFGDPVATPDGPASFVGYWDDRTLAKVKMDGGWYRSFLVADIQHAIAPEFIRGVLELANVRTAVDAVTEKSP